MLRLRLTRVCLLCVYIGARRQWGGCISEPSGRIFKHGAQSQDVSTAQPQITWDG